MEDKQSGAIGSRVLGIDADILIERVVSSSSVAAGGRVPVRVNSSYRISECQDLAIEFQK